MTSRERMLIALNNQKPDRLPCQVHNWMSYYLDNYLGGINAFEAYEKFDMDMAIYAGPIHNFDEKDLANWQVEVVDLGTDSDGTRSWIENIKTPEGNLTVKMASNKFTQWIVEHMIKNKEDFELFKKYFPVPSSIDGTPVKNLKEQLGDRGIIRGIIWCYGQMGAWQSMCELIGTENAIMTAMDEPDWMNYALQSMVDNQLKTIEMMENEVPFDLVELGGGGGSNTVISPAMHEEFCLPYDKQHVDALHSIGIKTVYHLCGGVMKVLDLVVQNGTDGLETMTPPGMGGDCILEEASKQVGDKLFFIGGFDQNEGFERGNPQKIREMVFKLHAACPDGGYICCPSDHFFFGETENIQAFVDACKECTY
ncbi:MAG: uroporphyrinogen decarboxylase family protein [Armatimonadota bacterium]